MCLSGICTPSRLMRKYARNSHQIIYSAKICLRNDLCALFSVLPRGTCVHFGCEWQQRGRWGTGPCEHGARCGAAGCRLSHNACRCHALRALPSCSPSHLAGSDCWINRALVQGYDADQRGNQALTWKRKEKKLSQAKRRAKQKSREEFTLTITHLERQPRWRHARLLAAAALSSAQDQTANVRRPSHLHISHQ